MELIYGDVLWTGEIPTFLRRMRYINLVSFDESKLMKFYFNPSEGDGVTDFKGTMSLFRFAEHY